MSAAKRNTSVIASGRVDLSTPVVDPASVPASSHVSAVTPTPPAGTTEKNFSKFELEAKQRAGAAKPDSPKTVFDGLSVLSTDGGIPVDYDDGELEDEVTSSSQSHASKPTTGNRRPREDDSDASSSKGPRSASDAVPSSLEALAITSERDDATRTDDSVREPWMPSESVIKDRYGSMVPPNEIPLYVVNRIVDDAEAAAKHFEPTTNQSSKKTSGRSRVPEWQALCQSWNQFVANFNNDSAAYRERIASARERFMKYSITSVVQRVHESSVNANIPSAVLVGVHYPHCSPGAPRISERNLTGYTTNRVPANTRELRAKLACTRQHPSVVPEHNTPRNTAPRSVTPPVRHLFRTVRHQDVSGKPRISKETRLSPTNTKTNRTSVRLRSGVVNNPIHLAVDRTVDGVILLSVVLDAHLYDQPRIDYGIQALHARVEAVERIQVSQMAELRQELFLQKAYVAEAAQTTSNIRVEVLEQVRLLQEKVKRIEEKVRALRASSSTSHHG
ncbi:LOW QUALITY PROTEIN: hypothetical protein PHMEG_00033761 [Phytophthora megakarya]|uniref:Uncharacterized protein n=1 Tax=Phytophthora megakarya TaxID=4795 RepID=A0A225USS3_9STRA|nr:LOW QUALITY PROTEIN: hypothetical protein PHMEG_00033761 [Phytophthora megakarya]